MTDLAPFSLAGRFWRGNLHTHSTLSDGALAPDKVVEAYKDTGYDFMMLSDHFIDHFNWPIADTRKHRSNNFTTIIGSELHALQTSAGELWHIVAAGLPLDFAPCAPEESGAELARRAAEDGAFIASSPVNAIAVVCGHSRTAQRIGKSITSATLDLRKLEKGWLLTKQSPWLRVIVIDQAGKRAWTNPIWKDEL
jgi:hypothetical protein